MMVAEPRIWVDVEQAVRSWARASLPSLSGRVGFGLMVDQHNVPLMPQITLYRIAGPDDRCLIQFNCYASSTQGKAVAAQTAVALCTAADSLGRYVSSGTVLKGAVVEDSRWQPDAESNLPCYIVDVTFFAMAGS